jgi:hypothetical protein
MARKDSLKMAQHFEMAQQKCVQRFAVFDRSAVGPLLSSSRGHPRLLGARQTKDVDGRNKSGHDGALVLVIASEAKQSSRPARSLDCFVAEPVIGPATSGRTRWLLAMTKAPTPFLRTGLSAS